jgi:hypothetical protein
MQSFSLSRRLVAEALLRCCWLAGMPPRAGRRAPPEGVGREDVR